MWNRCGYVVNNLLSLQAQFYVRAGCFDMGAILHNISRTFLQLFFLILILEPSVAPTCFTRRDILWDDSPWLEDVGIGMGGIGALYDILNKMRDTEVQPPIKSPGLPGNSLDQEGSQPATPDEQRAIIGTIQHENMLRSKRWSSERSIWWGSSWCQVGFGEAGFHDGVGFKDSQRHNSNLRRGWDTDHLKS